MVDQGSALARRDSQVRRAPNSAGLYDILDLILDKGIVVDAFVRVSLVGIELLTIDARVVIASVDTYLRYAEGAERLQLYNRSESQRLPEFIGGMAKKKMATTGIKTAGKLLGGSQGEDDDDAGPGIGGRIAEGVRGAVGRIASKITGGDDDDDEGGDDAGESKKSARPEKSPRANGHGDRAGKAGARR